MKIQVFLGFPVALWPLRYSAPARPPAWAGPYGPIRAHMGPYGPIWAHMGPIWAHIPEKSRKIPKNS